jgi:hypothetical protein
MQVVNITDTTNEAGNNIMDTMMCEEWRSGTDLKMAKGAPPKTQMLVYIEKMYESSVLVSNPTKQSCLLWP